MKLNGLRALLYRPTIAFSIIHTEFALARPEAANLAIGRKKLLAFKYLLARIF